MRNMPYKKRKKVSAQQVALFATAYFFIPLQNHQNIFKNGTIKFNKKILNLYILSLHS